MNDIPLSLLFTLLAGLIVLSALFSAAEIALMTLDRYRLRHLAKIGVRGARLAQSLLARPDRLIGVLLLGISVINALIAAIITDTVIRLMGDNNSSLVVATLIIAFVILIFTEVTPKTYAVVRPERVAFPSAFLLAPLLKLFYPVVWVINGIANGLLRLVGVTPEEAGQRQLTHEELRTVVNEAGAVIPRRHQKMLLSILDLEKATVEDIMVPRSEVVGLDLSDEWDEIVRQLTVSQHTRLPVYRDNIDNMLGILHLRDVLHLIAREKFDEASLLQAMREPYFVPEGTSLNTQLLHFQKQKRRIALVVDEYGDIQGLVTLEDILEEIVGEFTTDISTASPDVYPADDGSFLVDASANVRVLNRVMNWELPVDGPKTVNGIILEYMETIPDPGTSVMIAGYPIEIMQTTGSAIKTVKIKPLLRKRPPTL